MIDMEDSYMVLKEILEHQKDLTLTEERTSLKQKKEKQRKTEMESQKRKICPKSDVACDKENYYKKGKYNAAKTEEVVEKDHINEERIIKEITNKGKIKNQKGEKVVNKDVGIQSTSKTKQKNKTKRGKDVSDRSLERKRERVRNNVRKHREKMTMEQLEEKRRKDRERYRLKKEKGLIKSIADHSEREKRMKRRAWKINSKNYRIRVLAQKRATEFMENETPPASDTENLGGESRKIRGRKKVKRDRAEAYRKLAKATAQIEIWKKRAERYKKRLHRVSTPSTSKSSPSPNTRVKHLIKGINVPTPLKRRLLFGETLQDVLKENKNKITANKEKQLFNKVISGQLLSKYKLVGQAQNLISYKMQKKFKDNLRVSVYDRKKRNIILTQERSRKIQEFLENDENSRLCPGKNDFIQKKRKKKQKRLLLDSMKNLHKKFIQSSHLFLSYTTFCRLKPFWIVKPKMRDRETCTCVKHANVTLITEALFYNKLIAIKKPDDFFKHLVCSTESKMCMFKLCPKCKNKKILLGKDNFIRLNDIIKYQQWKTISEERIIKNQKKNIKVTTKIENITSVSELFRILNQQLTAYQRHVYMMKHQMKQMQDIKKNVDIDTLVLQIDFSENYITKFDKEIQSMHFGASKKQISLHTGV